MNAEQFTSRITTTLRATAEYTLSNVKKRQNKGVPTEAGASVQAVSRFLLFCFRRGLVRRLFFVVDAFHQIENYVPL